MKEIRSLTGLRGVAALYIMIFHFFNSLVEKINSNHWFFILIKKIISKGYISVDLFFILSAFVLTLSYKKRLKTVTIESYKYYILKRLIRIYPLYIVVLLISFVFQSKLNLKFILSYVTLNQSFVNNTVLNGLNPSVWSLSTEFYAYLIFPFILVFIINIKSKVADFVVLLFSLITLMVIQYLPYIYYDFETHNLRKLDFVNNNLDISIGYSAVIRTFISYFLGALFFKYINQIPKLNSLLFFALIIVFILIDLNDLFIYISFFLFIKSLLNKSSLTTILSSKYVYLLGLISYSIYLWHFIVLRLLEYFRFFPDRMVIVRLLAVFITIVLSYITYYLIEVKSKEILLKKMIKKE